MARRKVGSKTLHTKQHQKGYGKEPTFVEKGSDLDKQQQAEFRAAIDKVNKDFIQYVRDEKLMDNEYQIHSAKFSQMNKFYYKQMMMACVLPLTRELSTDSIVESLGMYMGLALCSKDFRQYTSESRQEAMRNTLSRKLDAMEDKGRGDSRKAERLRRKLNHAEKQMNDGRYPMTSQSAALTRIGFLETAYERMREPGADVAQIMTEYQDAIEALEQRQRNEGLADESVAQAEHVIVGRLIETDPKYQRMFHELSYEGVTKAEDKPMEGYERGKDGVSDVRRVSKRWNGEFNTRDGKRFTGHFTPRIMGSADTHAQHIADFVYDTAYTKAQSGSDVRNEADVAQCFVESLQRKHPRVYEIGDMVADDNIPQEQRDNILRVGYMRALSKLDYSYPDVRMADIMKDKQAYAAFYKQWQMTTFGQIMDPYVEAEEYQTPDVVYEEAPQLPAAPTRREARGGDVIEVDDFAELEDDNPEVN